MPAPDLDLVLHLAIPESDPEALDRAAARLRREVRELPVANVGSVVASSSPTGAKSGPEAVAIGAIAVSLAPHVIAPLFDLLKGWMNRNPGVATKIRYKTATGDETEIEFDPGRMSGEQIAGLVETMRKG